MRFLKAVLLAGAMASVTAAGAIAAGGGGGGGGGSMPSASGPSYDPAAEYTKALTALNAQDYKTAVRAAQRVTDALPKSVDGWKLLGAAYRGSENWKGAKRAYERAVKLSPDDLALRGGLAISLAKLQDAKAQEQLGWLKAKADACANTCPEAANLRVITKEVESAMGGDAGAAPKPAAALETGSLLFADGRAGDTAYVQAVSLINEKRYDDALAALNKASEAFGPHPDVLTYKGYTWRKKGDFARAETYYKQALAVAPDHRGATEYYGELKVERGDMAGAKLMLAKLDRLCSFGCAEAEELRRWIDAGGEPRS
jgi:Tfp pilus assembly protein PilF